MGDYVITVWENSGEPLNTIIPMAICLKAVIPAEAGIQN